MNTESTRLVSVHNASITTGTTVSNIESTTSLNNKRSDTESVRAKNQQPAPVHPEFAFFDDHIEVRTVDQTFWVHEYRLSKFTVFAALIQSAKSSGVSDTGRVIVTCDNEIRGEDVYNTLKVIYASHIDGIPDFDSSTMISTLRIASSFDYPALRKFAISKLEGMNLTAIQRIQLSDEFSLPTWETPAFAELCSRKEPVSQAEAEVLGITRFVEIARIRETERTRLAVNFTSDMYGELLQATNVTSSSQAGGPDGSSSKQNHFDYASGRLALPACNCSASQGRFGDLRVNHCSIHQVAHLVLKEGQTLFKQQDQLLEKLGKLQSTFNYRFDQGDFSLTLGTADLDSELSNASWIRRECAVVS